MPDPSFGAPKTLRVVSAAYANGSPIPREYTCDGRDISPPLAWSGSPAAAKAHAIVMDDPDAPGKTWLHWTAWDLPPSVTELVAGARIATMGGFEGRTDSGDVGYHGPCPPPGTHRYFTRVYALKEPLRLPAGSDLGALQKALEGRVLAWGETMGTYRRA